MSGYGGYRTRVRPRVRDRLRCALFGHIFKLVALTPTTNACERCGTLEDWPA